MANQPETATFDAGVYQLETADPVQGGVGGLSNTPLLNLANRTAYLKSHMDAIEAGSFIPPTVAPLNSPTFTGDPKAPTAPAGDDDTSIATTAFVQNRHGGFQSVDVSGNSNVTLTATQHGAGIIKFTGTLTGSINVIFPIKGAWIVANATSGAFTITCKTSGGTGIVVPQGRSNTLNADGTNIVQQKTDFSNISASGTFTAPDAATWGSGGIANLTKMLVNTAAAVGTEKARINGDVYVDGAGTFQSNLRCDNGDIYCGNSIHWTGFGVDVVASWSGFFYSGEPINVQIVANTNGVVLNSGTTSWSAISDYRAKNVLGPFAGSGEIIDAVPVHLAALKSEPGAFKAMFLAHEVQAAVPYAVHGDKDAVDGDGKAVMQSVQTTDPLVPILWAEVQNLRARLARLERLEPSA